MRLKVGIEKRGYEVVIEEKVLDRVAEELQLNRRVLVVTDSGVPAQYAQKVAAACKKAVVETVEEGEASKSPETFIRLLSVLQQHHFTREDCVVAVGGGVVGDLSGFVAASYMRGIDFYNIPTTVLSQVDSSVGGKTGINLNGVKNSVGAFYQPRKVLMDPEVLSTLPDRQIANGLAEAVKMSLTSDAELFRLFEEIPAGQIKDIKILSDLIGRAVSIKINVVEQDEKEHGLRRILNFGHTIGHGIESACGLSELLHGESVAVGMMPMCSAQVRERLEAVLRKIGLPTASSADPAEVERAMVLDKKAESTGLVRAISVPEVGSFDIKEMSLQELTDRYMKIAYRAQM